MDTTEGVSAWDRFWLSFYQRSQHGRWAGAAIRRGEDRTKRRRSLALRISRVHPVLGGLLAGLQWGAFMFVIFGVLTLFRHPVLLAIAWSIGGALFGLTMGSLWSVLKRHGIEP